MVKFLLIRHGHSVANENEFFAGNTDVPLSGVGLLQAKALCDYLITNSKIDAFYSSELSRAIYTVQAAADNANKTIITSSSFNEIFGGSWEGKKFLQINAEYPSAYALWKTDIANSTCSNGESFNQLKDRAFKKIIELTQTHDGQTVLIATHAGVIRAILSAACGLTDRQTTEIGWVTNASITTLLYENGRFTLEQLSYDLHLKDLKVPPPANI